jgi:hypothetical protein
VSTLWQTRTRQIDQVAVNLVEIIFNPNASTYAPILLLGFTQTQPLYPSPRRGRLTRSVADGIALADSGPKVDAKAKARSTLGGLPGKLWLIW